MLIVPVLINQRFSPSYFFCLPSMPHRVGGGGLMSLELRHSLFHMAEHCYIIRFHLWSKSKPIFHVPPLYAASKRLHCFKRKILG